MWSGVQWSSVTPIVRGRRSRWTDGRETWSRAATPVTPVSGVFFDERLDPVERPSEVLEAGRVGDPQVTRAALAEDVAGDDGHALFAQDCLGELLGSEASGTSGKQ